ncbi:hypothetical protein DSLASN_19980 [Desulfoluna limicola]|uniref:Fis family transcriptional regulator n=1 Tax=Desulfoluna limicola TaxID=2810562 RepID=A0ABM7PGK2_9BACT|nr:sigma 54-interacting transcriptional regulator [Desulfoluna limicola]BCS96366.1 hypothetical protein DSLASN_19980 [Desulfoluna limicola]
MEFGGCWEAVVENVRDGLLVVDNTGKIVAVNPSFERMTGYISSELVGESCRILNCTGCKIFGEEADTPWCKLFVMGKVKNKECVLTHKDGRTVHVLKSGMAMPGENGEAMAVVETLTDISQTVHQQEEIVSLRKDLCMDQGYHGLLGKSVPMQELFELIENISKSEAPVFIEGESGTGKELVARAIHEAGPRKGKPFIKVNCAALNESLLESELFGHVKGAFTGADRERIGRFEAAHEGTLFLDEVGDIPLSTQVKLLRVLEEREIEKVGDHHPIRVDVRLISATNKDLSQLIREGVFRQDFYFRINVFPISCPSLSLRKDDIPLLAKSFIERYASRDNKGIHGMTREAMETLMAYGWPGNIRELRNTIEYALVLCPRGLIGKEHLPPVITLTPVDLEPRQGKFVYSQRERDELARALEKNAWNQSATAKGLGVSRVTVWKRIKKYGLTPESLSA